MAVSDDVVLFCLSVVIYVALAITWNFALFKASEKNDENNIIKVLIVWLLLWVQPLLVQLLLEIAAALSRSADIITLFETYYLVSVYVAWIISIYFMIFFGYNVMIWLSNVTKRKRSG